MMPWAYECMAPPTDPDCRSRSCVGAGVAPTVAAAEAAVRAAGDGAGFLYMLVGDDWYRLRYRVGWPDDPPGPVDLGTCGLMLRISAP